MPDVNGVPTEAAGQGGCPAGMIAVSNFCVDRYEAALVEVDAGGQVLGGWSPYRSPAGARVKAVSAAGVVPQGYISQVEAAAACQMAGKRLCSEVEWDRACKGSQGTTYPYGNQFQTGACNTVRACHPGIQYHESSASWIWDELDHPCINQLPEGLAPTGEFGLCQTEDGAFDMSGNLHEWTSNSGGVFRGGYYVDAVRNNHGCNYRTGAHNTRYRDYSTGFRCCASR